MEWCRRHILLEKTRKQDRLDSHPASGDLDTGYSGCHCNLLPGHRGAGREQLLAVPHLPCHAADRQQLERLLVERRWELHPIQEGASSASCENWIEWLGFSKEDRTYQVDCLKPYAPEHSFVMILSVKSVAPGFEAFRVLPTLLRAARNGNESVGSFEKLPEPSNAASPRWLPPSCCWSYQRCLTWVAGGPGRPGRPGRPGSHQFAYGETYGSFLFRVSLCEMTRSCWYSCFREHLLHYGTVLVVLKRFGSKSGWFWPPLVRWTSFDPQKIHAPWRRLGRGGNHLALGRWNVEMLASISFAFILPGGQWSKSLLMSSCSRLHCQGLSMFTRDYPSQYEHPYQPVYWTLLMRSTGRSSSTKRGPWAWISKFDPNPSVYHHLPCLDIRMVYSMGHHIFRHHWILPGPHRFNLLTCHRLSKSKLTWSTQLVLSGVRQPFRHHWTWESGFAKQRARKAEYFGMLLKWHNFPRIYTEKLIFREESDGK